MFFQLPVPSDMGKYDACSFTSGAQYCVIKGEKVPTMAMNIYAVSHTKSYIPSVWCPFRCVSSCQMHCGRVDRYYEPNVLVYRNSHSSGDSYWVSWSNYYYNLRFPARRVDNWCHFNRHHSLNYCPSCITWIIDHLLRVDQTKTALESARIYKAITMAQLHCVVFNSEKYILSAQDKRLFGSWWTTCCSKWGSLPKCLTRFARALGPLSAIAWTWIH